MVAYSGKTVSQKLGIKPGFCIFIDGAPSVDVTLKAALKPPIDMVHLFVTHAAGLAAKLRRFRPAVAPDGMIWVSWPKKSSGVVSDLSDAVVRDTALPVGLVDIKVCAVDDTWSGLKFVIPADQRRHK